MTTSMVLLFLIAHAVSEGFGHVDYDESTAMKMVEFARVPFCDDATIKDWSCGDACRNSPEIVHGSVRIIQPGSVKGVIAQLQSAQLGKCIMGFRGSVNVPNWLIDLQAQLDLYPPRNENNIKVHRGFLDEWYDMRRFFVKSIQELECTSMIVVGHSLGAGIATMSTFDFRLNEVIKIETLWTFGSPPVGNLEFANTFIELAKKHGANPPSWRVTHSHDPVPRLNTPDHDYYQVPEEVHYSLNSDKFELCAWNAIGYDGASKTCGERRFNDWIPLLTSGLRTDDHLHYMNKTFKLTERDEKCVLCTRLTNSGCNICALRFLGSASCDTTSNQCLCKPGYCFKTRLGVPACVPLAKTEPDLAVPQHLASSALVMAALTATIVALAGRKFMQRRLVINGGDSSSSLLHTVEA